MEIEQGLYIANCHGDRPIAIVPTGVMLVGPKFLFTQDEFFAVNEVTERIKDLEITFIVDNENYELFEDGLNVLYKQIEHSNIKVMSAGKTTDEVKTVRSIKLRDTGFYLQEPTVKCIVDLTESIYFRYNLTGVSK